MVESDYGYHIIKLENRTDTKDSNGNPSVKYDVRHILISTGYKDPSNPLGREVPIKQYVSDKIESDKEKALVDQLVAESGVTVAEDYNVPQISDEQIQEMMKKQQGPMMMQPGAEGDEDAPAAAPNGTDDKGGKDAKPEAKKPAPAKK